MNRRSFLKLGVGGGVAAIAATLYTLDQNRAWAWTDYPFESVADSGTTLDEAKSAKARKVAGYVAKIKKRSGIIKHTQSENGVYNQSYDVLLVIDGERYRVLVTKNLLTPPSEASLKDSISIELPPQKAIIGRIGMVLVDNGLDGRCDDGVISANLSGIGRKIYFEGNEGMSKTEERRHQYRFQSSYSKALDSLISFYERQNPIK